MRCLTEWVHGLRLLFASAIWLSCASGKLSWASSNIACNHSMNTGHARLYSVSCCHWHTAMCTGIDGVIGWFHWTWFWSVGESVGELYTYSASESKVINMSWQWVVKACWYWVSSWFKIAGASSVCRWHISVTDSSACNQLHLSAQKSVVPCISLLLMMSPEVTLMLHKSLQE